MRDAALRVAALRLCDQGERERETARLRESRTVLAGIGERREMALTAHELATTLEREGRKLRKEVAAYAGCELAPTLITETRPEAVRRTAPARQKRPSSCQAAFNLQEKQVFFFFKEPTYDFLRG